MSDATPSSPVYDKQHHKGIVVDPIRGLKEMLDLIPTSDTTVCLESQDEESSEDPIGHLPDSTTLSPVHVADNSSISIGVKPLSPHPAYLANAALFNIPTGSVADCVDVVEEETEIIEDALFDLLRMTNKSPVVSFFNCHFIYNYILLFYSHIFSFS